MIHNNKMENKTLVDLYSKKINRFAKVIYLFFYGVALLFFVGIIWNDGFDYETILGILITIVIFEAIKRGFYYIILGTINPK